MERRHEMTAAAISGQLFSRSLSFVCLFFAWKNKSQFPFGWNEGGGGGWGDGIRCVAYCKSSPAETLFENRENKGRTASWSQQQQLPPDSMCTKEMRSERGRTEGRKEGKRSTIFDRPLIRVCDDDDVSGGGDEDPISGSNLALSIKWKMADSTVGHPVVRAFVWWRIASLRAPPPSTTTPSSYCLSFEWTWWLAECDSQVDRRRGAAKRKREKKKAGNPSKSSDGGRRVGQWRNDSIGQLQKTERPVRSTRARWQSTISVFAVSSTTPF